MKSKQPSQRTCQRVRIRWIALFADFIVRWWVVLAAGALLTAASMMNSFAVMRVNENMVVLTRELRAMQTMQQARQGEMQEGKPKSPVLLSNEASSRK